MRFKSHTDETKNTRGFGDMWANAFWNREDRVLTGLICQCDRVEKQAVSTRLLMEKITTFRSANEHLFTVNTERCTCMHRRSPKHVGIESVSWQKELKWMNLLKYQVVCAFVCVVIRSPAFEHEHLLINSCWLFDCEQTRQQTRTRQPASDYIWIFSGAIWKKWDPKQARFPPRVSLALWYTEVINLHCQAAFAKWAVPEDPWS